MGFEVGFWVQREQRVDGFEVGFWVHLEQRGKATVLGFGFNPHTKPMAASCSRWFVEKLVSKLKEPFRLQ